MKAKKTKAAKAPAVHGDVLWGGPRVIDAFPGSPFVKTKTEYKALLRKHGMRMRDQQESRFGDAVEIAPKVEIGLPPIVVAPMLQDEANVYATMKAFLRRHGLVETVWCNDCYARNRHHGCRTRVDHHEVMIECRCGIAKYQPPPGTTDLVLSTLSTAKIVLSDKTRGSVFTSAGPVDIPTVLLNDVEARLVRLYMHNMIDRHKEPRIFHGDCWSGVPARESEALAIEFDAAQLKMLCSCKMLFHQSQRVSGHVH